MTKDEALSMALDFIERVNKDGWILADFEPEMYAAITAIKESLKQSEQEPVAYYHPHKGFYWAKPTRISAPTAVDVKPLPLYTTPPQLKEEDNDGRC